ncbi:MAG: rRNA adenine N-6-methyltransferase family protein [Nocardioidaceae bacterium]
MSRLQPGPHELGQNFLQDSAVIARIVALVAQTSGPIVEWGTGDGALTRPLAQLEAATRRHRD